MNKCSHVHKFLEITHPQCEEMAEFFKAMGDPTRLGILYYLLRGEKQVSDLAHLVNSSPSAVSHQLRLLRSMRLVKARRDGRNIFYSLDDTHIEDILRIASQHTEEARGK